MRLSATEHNRRLDAYNRGLTDREAAQELGIKQKTFADWRRCHGLKVKRDEPFVDVSKMPIHERLIVRRFLIQLFQQVGGVV